MLFLGRMLTASICQVSTADLDKRLMQMQVPLESSLLETMIAARLSASTFLLSDILQKQACSVRELLNDAQVFDRTLLECRVSGCDALALRLGRKEI